MTTRDRETAIVKFVRARLSLLVKVPVEEIDVTSSLVDLGLQSVDAVLLCGEVEDRFQVELDPSSIFEHDTVGSFTAYVARRLEAR
ncbi:acyl carrier protein [Methylorubrum rhodinum]|uniref:Acyl carrier protein n=1 Tax=Methylorubrum rhodinum TaxID=29428 RepID=A0A840ZJC9_9HYPH|nr:acyl carrier protein [Methylorubrum rhodinum]MBB5758192.1 acyl carrier protein [Methylorubrum rhodinum]